MLTYFCDVRFAYRWRIRLYDSDAVDAIFVCSLLSECAFDDGIVVVVVIGSNTLSNTVAHTQTTIFGHEKEIESHMHARAHHSRQSSHKIIIFNTILWCLLCHIAHWQFCAVCVIRETNSMIAKRHSISQTEKLQWINKCIAQGRSNIQF